jgi:hypothetical protein
MKALSVRQPWAWLIVNGIKDIENRNWETKYTGRVYIHAGLKMDKSEADETEIVTKLTKEEQDRYFSEPKARGAIVGEVDITGCVTMSSSPWFTGKYGFVLANALAYKKPIECKGALNFFKPHLPSTTK